MDFWGGGYPRSSPLYESLPTYHRNIIITSPTIWVTTSPRPHLSSSSIYYFFRDRSRVLQVVDSCSCSAVSLDVASCSGASVCVVFYSWASLDVFSCSRATLDVASCSGASVGVASYSGSGLPSILGGHLCSRLRATRIEWK